MQFDLVVLHGHPFDVVPAIAFAGSGGPSVVVLNHAGFAFWVGRDVADAVACLRPSTCRLAKERRGIESTRLLVLPIPVEPPPTSPTRLEARRMLDVPADAVVLLTVANPSKYVPFEPGPSFMELVTSVSLRDERVRVLAVGPDDRGPWRAASERTEGRVRAFGTRDDPDLFARAADVYLDSFPVSSPTSFLDAGRHGVPIVSFCPHRERAPILCPDDPSPLGDLIVRVETPAAFAEALDGLVEDEAAREELGRSTAEAILSGHSLDAFGASLDDVYARAASLQGTARRSDQAVPAPGEIDDCLARMLDASGLSVSVSRLLTRHLESFPPRARPWLRLRIRAARLEGRG